MITVVLIFATLFVGCLLQGLVINYEINSQVFIKTNGSNVSSFNVSSKSSSLERKMDKMFEILRDLKKALKGEELEYATFKPTEVPTEDWENSSSFYFDEDASDFEIISTTRPPPLPRHRQPRTGLTCPSADIRFVCECTESKKGLSVVCSNAYYEDIIRSFKSWDESLSPYAERKIHSLGAYGTRFSKGFAFIASDFFASFTIDKVTLYRNELMDFHPNVFDRVQHLDLGYNKLKTLSLRNFGGTYANLRYNPIVKVKPRSFRPEKDLYIDFCNSRPPGKPLTIEPGFIDLSLFNKTSSKLTIDLRNTKISTLHKDVFLPIIRVNSTLTFYSHDIVCNCSLNWMLEEHDECRLDAGFERKLVGHGCGDLLSDETFRGCFDPFAASSCKYYACYENKSMCGDRKGKLVCGNVNRTQLSHALDKLKKRLRGSSICKFHAENMNLEYDFHLKANLFREISFKSVSIVKSGFETFDTSLIRDATFVNFSGNSIRLIERDTFPAFDEIDLSNNDIETIERGAFGSNQMFPGDVILSNNRLSIDSFESEFVVNSAIKALDLRGNRMKGINQTQFGELFSDIVYVQLL